MLSTFNGEKYLADQLDSVIAQTYTDWQLLIRDDGSSDKTLEIIENYLKKDARISLINAKNRENIGITASFFELLKYEIADFYFFCDQDDVWLPEKIEKSVKLLEKQDNRLAQLMYASYDSVGENLKIIHEGMLRRSVTDLRRLLTENAASGWTMGINHALAAHWQLTDGVFFHDWYLALLAAANGEVHFLNEKVGLYRQHAANVVGIKEEKQKANFKVRLSESATLIVACQRQAAQVIRESSALAEGNFAILNDFATLSDVSFLRRFWRVLKYHYERFGFFSSLKLRFVLVTGFGRKTPADKKK